MKNKRNGFFSWGKEEENISEKHEFVVPEKTEGTGKRSDILLRQDGAEYRIGFWKEGQTKWQCSNIVHSDTWKLLGCHDMDGDGKADVVAVGSAGEGAEKITYVGYYHNGIDNAENWHTIGSFVTPEAAKWQLAIGNLTGKKDFNSIVWYSPKFATLGVWIDGTTQWVGIDGIFGENWKLVGCGDFDGSGKDSVVMSCDKGTRYFAIALDGTLQELHSMGSEWKVCAIGDFDGNGKDSLIFYHARLGLLAQSGVKEWKKLGQLDGADWQILGCGNYSGNAAADLLVRQKSTGAVGYYIGGDLSCWHQIGTLNQGWNIIL